jgi:hypothetical protein
MQPDIAERPRARTSAAECTDLKTHAVGASLLDCLSLQLAQTIEWQHDDDTAKHSGRKAESKSVLEGMAHPQAWAAEVHDLYSRVVCLSPNDPKGYDLPPKTCI